MRLVVAAAAALAMLLAILPQASAAPEQVHLGLPTSDPATSASVLWLDATPEDAPHVTLETPGGPTTVAGALVPGPSVGFAYEATLGGLAPATNYSYHVGGKTFSFTTPAAAPQPFRIVALGDMGADANAAATLATIQRLAPDLVLHSGDISYAGGDPTVWAAWFGMVEPVAARAPWVTALGNHEADVEGAGAPIVGSPLVSPTEQAFYKQRFSLPANELWYSFDWQGAHFVALDTFSQVDLPADELAWLDQDLAAHANASWRIVFLHEPPYSSNAAHGSSARIQKSFVPLFEKHHVDLVIAAHDHSYERFDQLVGGAPVASADHATYAKGAGPLYVVSGGGGAGLYKEWRSALVPGSVAHDASWHVLQLDVTPDAIAGRYVATGSGAAGSFADAFTIHAPPSTASGEVSGAVGARAAPAIGAAAVVAIAMVVAFAFFGSRRAE